MAYLSTPCTDASAGKQSIRKAIDALFSPQDSDGSEGHLETTSDSTDDVKPTLIWSCVYVQEITQVNFFSWSLRTVSIFVSVLVKKVFYIYLFHYLTYPLSCLSLSGNVWSFTIMPHAWWKSGLQEHTGINKKGIASSGVAVVLWCTHVPALAITVTFSSQNCWCSKTWLLNITRVIYMKIYCFYGRFRIVNASFTSVALSWWIHFVLLLQLFAGIYPDEEFLPKKSAPVYTDGDSDSAE